MGLAEYAYLSSLTEEERGRRLREFFARKIPCVVVARNKRVFPVVAALGEEFAVPILKTRMITKHFVNAATIIMENLTAPRLTVQGTMIEIQGIGVLIQGKTGMGKSETALALIRKGASLVSDDITALRLDSAGSVIGSAVSITRYHMESRGLGIIHVPSLFGVASVRGEKKLDLIVTLRKADAVETDKYPESRRMRDVLGVSIPEVSIPVAAGRDLANMVEAAALDQTLKGLGHDAVKELDEKLMAVMRGSKVGSE
jgi:HPr kinase/phosphorylase